MKFSLRLAFLLLVIFYLSSFAHDANSSPQGSEIFDAALCGASGGGGSIASYNIKAAIFMGDPRFKAGAPYNVGTCTAGGFDQRSGTCGSYNDKIQSYCDVSTLTLRASKLLRLCIVNLLLIFDCFIGR